MPESQLGLTFFGSQDWMNHPTNETVSGGASDESIGIGCVHATRPKKT